MVYRDGYYMNLKKQKYLLIIQKTKKSGQKERGRSNAS